MESFKIDGQVDSSPFTVVKGDLCKKTRSTDNVMVAQFTHIDFLQAGQADRPHTFLHHSLLSATLRLVAAVYREAWKSEIEENK